MGANKINYFAPLNLQIHKIKCISDFTCAFYFVYFCGIIFIDKLEVER